MASASSSDGEKIPPPEIIQYNELNTYIINNNEEENAVNYNYIDSFTQYHDDIRWPLPFSTRNAIIATFGQVMDNNNNNINKGIDISGFEEDPVNAVYNGIINRVTRYGEVIIEHTFHHGNDNDMPTTMTWYTIYSNVNTNMNAGDEVQAGQEIGQLTSPSNDYEQPYLHFELQIEQSSCSSCSNSYNIHPLLLFKILYGPEYDRPTINIINDITPISNGILEIINPASQSNINKYSIQIIGKNKMLKKNHVINLNQKTSFTFAKDGNVPYISKGYLDYDTEIEIPIIKNQVVIPFVWVDHKESYDWFRLVIEDVWGKKTYFSFSTEHRSW